MNITDRLIEYCDKNKIKQIDLIDVGCGSKGTINNVFRKKNDPSSRFLEAFLKGFRDVDARWLLTGEENSLVEEDRAQYGSSKELIKLEGVVEFLKKECLLKDKTILDLRTKLGENVSGAESQANSEKRAS